MIKLPAKIGGKHKLAGWLNRLLEGVRACEVKQVVGGRLIENSDGKIIVVGNGSGGGGPAQMFILKEIFGDYIRCHPASLSQAGDYTVTETDTYIAKPPIIRNSIAWELFPDDTVLDYTYTTVGDRAYVERVVSENDVDIETQIVIPYYLPNRTFEDAEYPGDIIYAVRCDHTGVWRNTATSGPAVYGELTLLDISARAWATKVEEDD